MRHTKLYEIICFQLSIYVYIFTKTLRSIISIFQIRKLGGTPTNDCRKGASQRLNNLSMVTEPESTKVEFYTTVY